MYKREISDKTKLIIKIITIILLSIMLIISILHSLGFKFNVDFKENMEESTLSKDEKQEILLLFDSMSNQFLSISKACEKLDNDKLKVEIDKLIIINNKIQKTKLDIEIKNELNKSMLIWKNVPDMIDDGVFDYIMLVKANMHLYNAVQQYNYIYGDDYEI